MSDDERIEHLELEVKVLRDNNKGLKDKIDEQSKEIEELKEKNKNKDKILQNIREEFLKYDWKNAEPIQTYNQVKSLYESIYWELYED